MFRLKEHGNYDRIRNYLMKNKTPQYLKVLERYGQEGVTALSQATPRSTGLTASSWSYKVVPGETKSSIEFHNSNINNGVPIAIILQYGHGTGTGGWVEGRDYINPAIQPIFDKIAEEAWKEVTKI